MCVNVNKAQPISNIFIKPISSSSSFSSAADLRLLRSLLPDFRAHRQLCYFSLASPSVTASPISERFSNPSTLNGSEGKPLTDSEVIPFRGATKHYQASDRFRGNFIQRPLRGYQTAP
ncbi:hypothetical protein QVD17_26637 [Tagetes erecta]|uniref:Uncharacterized protein n=1 Tax=Tagetes erecta TaxID=13708 RepID=A0AAD8K7Q1_TARER|nr:hypothetical protein QVD17_26637 [Tagetes erecta]